MLYPIKIEFKDYPTGSWQDWSEYLTEPPRISKKVESENEGEAGLIVFDDAEVSFRYETGSPVYNAFSIDLTSKQRYLFRISAPKSDATYVQLFEGIADFSTLRWNEFNNVINFTIVDKLSALNLLQGELTRVLDTLNARVLAQHPGADGLEFKVDNNYPDEIWIEAAFGNSESYYTMGFATPIIFPGEIIRDPMSMQGSYPSPVTYALVTESWIDAGLINRIKYIKVDGFDYTKWLNNGSNHSYTVWFTGGGVEYGQKEIYGIDILNYSAGIPASINGLGLIEVLISKAWSGINFIYRGISAYNIPLSYYMLFLDENPLGKTPLDALKMIADSMKCYIFFDRTGSNLIVQSKSSLATGGTTRSIGSTKIISGPEKKYFWDKLVDGVTVNVKSWVLDDVTGENLIGVAELTKQPTGFSALQKIKPKNSIKRELLVGDPAIDTQEELNTYAAQEALSMLNFYGLRHSSFDINLNLDDNTINWELIDNLTIGTLTTFFTKMEIDLVARNISLEAVEITGHDYDFRQLVFGSAESSGSSIISSSSSGDGSFYGGITPIFNLPLQMSSGIVSLLTTDNLKLTSDQLDTAQPIKTTDTPTFNQMLLSAAATLSNHAVRADRTLQITTNAPLTGGGIAVDLTADRAWTFGINSANLLGTVNQITVVNGTGVVLGLNNVTLSLPQNIHTGATPTFNQLTLSSAGSGSSNAVRADRAINTSYPLTGGGNLTADRTIGLSYNTTNLKLTTNQLNTIQDIAITSTPTFSQLIISNAGTTTSNAVRADRAINTSYPLTGGGNLTADKTLGLSYNTTNLKLTSNQLNTIQDIATTSSPTFATPNFTNGYNIRYGGGNYGYAKVVSNYFALDNNQVYLQWGKPPILVGAAIKVTLFHFGESVSNQGIITKLFYIDWRNDGTINVQESEITDVIGRIYDYTGYIGNFEVYDTDKLRLLIAKPSVGNGSYQVMLEVYCHRVDYWQNYTISSPTSLTVSSSRIYRYYNNRLGLGITQPTEMLDVNGNIKAQTAKLTNLNDGYLPYHSSDAVGLVNSPIYSDNTKVGIGTTTLSEAFNLQGHFKQTGSYSLYNNFTSGWAGSGWRMDYNISNSNVSTLELDDLWVRGSLNVYELIINQIRATNGSLFVSSCGKIATVNSPTSITLEDPDGHNIAPFVKGDIILIQRVKLDSTTLTKRIVREVENVSNMTLTLSTLPDGPSDTGALEVGDVLVRIGNTSVASRRGSLYLTSDDSNAPYMDTINDVTSWTDWTSKEKLKVRIGRLSGITSDNFGSLSDYGLYAKGGVYIEGSGSNSIALKVDSSSAQLNMKQSGNSVFEFDTATSTAKIAGWNFNNSKMWANNLPTHYFLEMVGSGIYSHLYAGYGIEPYVDDTGVTFGRIPDGLPNSGSIGIMGHSEYYGETYFVLTDTKRSIAGWNFDGQKLYNATNIVLDGYNKKVSVNNDAVKMYYTDASNYGIKDSAGKFQLGSTNQIAGWNFNNLYLWKLTSGTPTSSPAGGIVMNSNGAITVYGNYWQKRVALYYSAANNWGLIGTNESYQTVFQLGYTNQIAGWVFDTTKLTSPSNYVQLVTDYTKIIAGSKAVLGNYASGLWGIKSENYQFVDSAQMLTLTSDSSTYWSDLRSETWTGVFASNNKVVNLVNEPFTSGTGGFTVNSYTGQSSIANMSGELAVTAYAISGGASADILISKGITTGIGGVVKPFSIKFDYHTYEYVLSGKVTSYGTYLVKIVENAYNGTVIKELYLDSTSDLRNMSVKFYSAASTIYIVVYVFGEFNVQLAGTNGYARLLLDNIKLYYWNAFNEISKDGIIFFNTESSYLQMGKDAFTFKGGAISCDSLTVNKINGYNACRFRGRSSTYPSSDMRPGDIYYNTSDGKVYIYNGNYWQALT